MSKRKGTALLFLAAAMGGFGFVAMKNVLDAGYTPIQCVAIRYIIAVIFMCLFYIKELKRITEKELKGGAVMGILLFMLFFMLMEGLKRTTPSVNAFLSCTTAVIVPFIVWAVFKKRPDIYAVLGALLAVIGVAMLSLNEKMEISLGAVISFGAAVMFAFQIVIMDRYVSQCSPVRLTIVESVVVMILAVAVSLFEHAALPFPKAFDIIMMLVSGIFCTFLYFLFQSIGQKVITPTSASIIITSESVFAAVSSAVFYGEQISFRMLVGCSLIFAAVITAEIKPKFYLNFAGKLLTGKAK